MSKNVKDLFKKAVSLTQKGQVDKAISLYQELIKTSPKDARALNNLGDLYIRKKMIPEAARLFTGLARIYEEDGYNLRAIAICQKVLKVDANNMEVKARVAELYTRQGLVAEARSQYLELANLYDKGGKVKEALEVFRQLADLDPSNLAVRAKLGSMFEKEGLRDRAAAEWAKAAEGHLRAGGHQQAHSLLEQAIGADPDCVQARALLAGEEIKADNCVRALELLGPVVKAQDAGLDALKLYAAALLKEQHYEEAVLILERALQREPASHPIRENLGLALIKAGRAEEAADRLGKMITVHLGDNRLERAEKLALELRQALPGDAQVLQRLVEIYAQWGKKDALVEAYVSLARLYEERGLRKNVLGIYEKLAEADPANPDWGERIQKLRSELGMGDRHEPAEPPVATAAGEPAEFDLTTLDEEAEEEEVLIEADQEELEVSDSPMAEVEGCLRKGLFKEAETKLRRMIAEEPGLDKLKMLKELYRLQNNTREYVSVCLDIADLLRVEGRNQEAVSEYQDVLDVEKTNRRAQDALAALVVELDTGLEPAGEEPPGEPDEEGEAVIEIPEADLEAVESGVEAIAEADLESLVPETAPLEDAALELPGEAVSEEAVVAAGPAPAPGGGEPEEMLAEADFYYQQGLYEEAERIFKVVLARDPGRLDVAARLDQISSLVPDQETESLALGEQDLADFERSLEEDLQVEQETRFSVHSTRGAGDETVDRTSDFTSFLSDLKEEVEKPVGAPGKRPRTREQEDESLQEIFQEFQKGVRENLSAEDFETHYNLGIAYKEMGLLDEAIAEFQLAARDPGYFVDSTSMMALCYRDKGDLPEAIRVAEGALDVLSPEDPNRKGVLWELAVLHEDIGNKEQASELYLEIYGLDTNYRGIEEKLKQYGKLEEPGPPAEERVEDKEIPGEDSADQEKEKPSEGRKSTRVSYI